MRRRDFEGVEWEEGREETERKSKDRKIHKERKRLVEFLKEKEWTIFNCAVKENEEEEYTYTGNRENTVIDYMIGRKRITERIKRLKIGERIDSDHHRVEVTIVEKSRAS